jgi:eukaryotic-like serine/threonine-protein kinase
MAMLIEELVDVGDIPGYEGIRLLGRGGMGVVYLARQLSLNRTVAVKLLASVPRVDPVLQAARFRREAELMARVSHPNIVAIHDYGVKDGQPYLAMEYVEGGDLGRWIVAERPVSPARVRPLVLPIAEALGCLHRSGILHRDLKPTNILMVGERTPKVSDFGIAVLGTSAGDLTQSGLALGTPGYVAPEQQYNLKVDERTDQYSMAAVFYELLTGRKPLGPFQPPSRYNPEVGPEVDAVLIRGLHEDREERYPTVEEFGNALDAALGLAGSHWRRGPVLATLFAAILAGLGVGVWVRNAGQGEPPQQRVPVPNDPPQQQRVPAPVDPIPHAIPPSVDPIPPAIPPEAAPPRVEAPKVAEPTLTVPALIEGRVINSQDMTLVLIRPGTFVMGAPAREADSQPDERPQHEVKITRPFYLATCEVTVGQFRKFVEATGYKTDAEQGGGGFVYDMGTNKIARRPGTSWRNPNYSEFKQTDDDPVVQVSRNDAMNFCDWLARKTGRVYRLPTEAEWEFACRAGTKTRWYSGDTPESLDAVAWTARNGEAHTHPVGRKKANAWGLHDMHGNAWEWVEDRHGLYSDKPAEDPIFRFGGDHGVLRGGAWDWQTPEKTRSAARLAWEPNMSYFTYGFRVAMTPVSEVLETQGQGPP